MQENNLKIKATTIHRLLAPQMKTDGSYSFFYNKFNKLPIQYLIIDEASMLGMSITLSLFQAVPDDCFVLFIGDHHQLPPVEKGAILRDMIAGGMPHGDLKEIFRNSGKIVECCKEIREGRYFTSSPSASYGAGPDNNLRHIETGNNEESVGKMTEVLSAIRQNPDIDILWSVQVLAFVNEGSELSRKELNLKLQSFLNPFGAVAVGRYKLGDKVICLKNRMYEWTNDHGLLKTEFIANGQMGEIIDHAGEMVTVLLKNSKEDKGSRVKVPKSLLVDEWDLGYAISIHKSQGSSWPIVIVAVDHSPRARYMASRQLVYTALSRAEKYCITIGQRKDINDACRKDVMSQRKTGLAELIKEISVTFHRFGQDVSSSRKSAISRSCRIRESRSRGRSRVHLRLAS